MIQYFFSFNRQNNLIYVEIHFEKITSDTLKLHLPAWRPGRYQLQNFAKNILDFCTYSPSSKLNFQKTSANIWEIDTSNTKSLVVKYTYYANELNAGSSLVNNEIFYINPVNMCMFVESPDPIRVTIDCEEDLNVACGMPFSRIAKSVIFNPKDYHEFYDSPIILSKKLEHHHFTGSLYPSLRKNLKRPSNCS
jgi:predicted metalloprotease with PDZ domain